MSELHGIIIDVNHMVRMVFKRTNTMINDLDVRHYLDRVVIYEKGNIVEFMNLVTNIENIDYDITYNSYNNIHIKYVKDNGDHSSDFLDARVIITVLHSSKMCESSESKANLCKAYKLLDPYDRITGLEEIADLTLATEYTKILNSV